ncbi:T9SS type A sorting domain-containing protein [Lewinella sp. JB7]|uniref:T9SS type A sorting domain-containing protein n=1 Tax=Lewinella sp. JB7 TaxID=2962887 RepID=UPI0020C9CE65|nr:T9SS type A sorting domain-containing protein [Lewinella sp. JB7]MCP9236706.1 T9SS type A sorting domain-containing protein [Lewinella sp. JB7]
MYSKITLLFTLLLVAVSAVQAQTRFVDPIYGVSEPTVATYGSNIDVYEIARGQAGDPNATPLRSLNMDVYQPVGDEDMGLRPVVVVFPTGNFLPQYVNQGLYGTRQDSAVVHLASELTRRGYVGIAAEYRVGWNPRGDQNTRTRTLLQAAYRGGQDAHMLARYLRKSVKEDENPYRIDTSRIVFWGLGTGGYVTMTHAYLDRVQEILDDERFYDENDVAYVDIDVNADPQGLLPAEFAPGSTSNVPNHVGYNSSVAMSINSNGALGDIDWIEGKDDEPLTLGFHSPGDIFAPFSYGNVVVPTTEDIVIGCVAGTEEILEVANAIGNNADIAAANSTTLPGIYSDLSVAVNVRNAAYKQQNMTLQNPPACPDQSGFEPTFPLSRDNMYPLQVGNGLGAGYNWVNEAQARARIQAFNDAGGNLNAETAIQGEGFVNPNVFNPERAKMSIDTMIAFFVPRAYMGMDLAELSTSTEDLIPSASVGLNVFPNPSTAEITVRVADAHRIRQIDMFDISGRRVAQFRNIDQSSFQLNRGSLPNGQYVLQLRFDEGTTARTVFLR